MLGVRRLLGAIHVLGDFEDAPLRSSAPREVSSAGRNETSPHALTSP